MMRFISKQWVGFYGSVVAAVLMIVSLALVAANGNTVYYNDVASLGGIIAAIVFAIVFTVAAVVVSETGLGENRYASLAADVVRAVGAMLMIVACLTFLNERVESFGYIFGSNIELGNETAFTAGGQAISVIVLCAVTWIISVVSAAFAVTRRSRVKAEKKAEAA